MKSSTLFAIAMIVLIGGASFAQISQEPASGSQKKSITPKSTPIKDEPVVKIAPFKPSAKDAEAIKKALLKLEPKEYQVQVSKEGTTKTYGALLNDKVKQVGTPTSIPTTAKGTWVETILESVLKSNTKGGALADDRVQVEKLKEISEKYNASKLTH